MTHLDKKPFECQLHGCDKGYCDARSLRRHLEQFHQLDPETAHSHAQASMAAAGIPLPSSRQKNKSGDSRGKQLSSPVYSPGSATPTPSPGTAGVSQGFYIICEKKTSNNQ